MKITKNYLKQIIKEELQEISSGELTPEKRREYDLDDVKATLKKVKMNLRDEFLKDDFERALMALRSYLPELN